MQNENSSEQGKREPSWLSNRLEPTIHVSQRAYRVVREVLNYPDSELKHGKILSVGEGFSDFARKLHDLLGADVIAIDPIYELGPAIFTKTKDKIRKIFKRKYGKGLLFNPIREERGFKSVRSDQTEKIEVQPPDPKRILAASAYELPFVDEAFDIVILYRTIQHLNPAIALPELVRVVKKDGEIRMGGISIQASLQQNQLFTGEIEISKFGNGYEFRPYGNFLVPLTKFLSSNRDLSPYVIVDALNSEGQRDVTIDLVTPRSIVIRKDKKLPKIAGPKTEIWKIDPTPIVSPYKMEIAMQFYSIGEDHITYYQIKPVK